MPAQEVFEGLGILCWFNFGVEANIRIKLIINFKVTGLLVYPKDDKRTKS